MTLPATPDDSTASWIDADDGYPVADFLDEATRILHDEEDFVDACHDRLRHEYEQWKRIPHLRIIGKRIDYSSENIPDDHEQIIQDVSRENTADNRGSDLLREQVIKIMTETLWQRVLDKISTKNDCRGQSLLKSRQHSSGPIESALTVSSILPTNRPAIVFKSRSRLETLNQNGPVCHKQSNPKCNKKPWPKNSVSVLPPIETHQKKAADKTKRWFSAFGTPGRNHAQTRPVTSVTTHHVNTAIDMFFDISIDGKSIKSLRKKRIS